MIRAVIFLLVLHLISTEATRNDGDCSSWRLPKAVLPTHYDITLDIPNDPAVETFKGAVVIYMRCIEHTDTITLNSRDLNMTTESITVHSGKELRVAKVRSDPKYEMIHINLHSYLEPGSVVVLNISEYLGKIHDYDGYGLLRFNERHYGRVTYATFFEPAFARMAFPCFDEPNMKATFTMKVIRPANYSSYSNMPVSTTSPIGDNLFMDVFEETPPMSTYVLAVTVNTLFYYPKNSSERTHIMLADGIIKQKDLKFMHTVAKNALQELEKYTGIPYSLPKLDHLILPEYIFDGMEHWGLVMYPQRIFSHLDGYTSMKHYLSHTIVHEIAHQWFGNLVTMDWWSNLWLNEAIPVYLQYVIGKKIHPEWGMEKLVISEFQFAMEYDGQDSGPSPLTNVLACNANQSMPALTAVSYDKGGSILKMFEFILGGEDNLREALRIYLKRRMMKTTKPSDLFDALDEVNLQLPQSRLPNNLTFKDVAAAWTEKPGVPLVTVTRNYETGSVFIRQERFYYNSTGQSQRTRWWIPLTWATSSSPWTNNSIHWFYEDETIHLNAAPDEWVLFNVNVTGLYRVQYDDKNFNLLARALETSPARFSAVNRAQLLDDAVALTIAGLLRYDIALNVSRFLLHEEDRVVWMKADRNLRELWKQDTSLLSVISTKPYIWELMSRGYSLVSPQWKPKDYEEPHLDAKLRDALEDFACTIGVTSCYRDRFLSWVSKLTHSIVSKV